MRDHRRHGPRGYSSYESYRPWLRDEFTFRCVYCLQREKWGQVTGEFDIDHFQPQVVRPDLAVKYTNLVYACRRCNSVKQGRVIDDPCATMVGTRIRALPDGTVLGTDAWAQRMVDALDLNSPKLVEFRSLWMEIVDDAIKAGDRDRLKRRAGFPRLEELPRLDRLKPPGGNSRPAGIAESYYALAVQGDLPDYY